MYSRSGRKIVKPKDPVPVYLSTTDEDDEDYTPSSSDDESCSFDDEEDDDDIIDFDRLTEDASESDSDTESSVSCDL